ncbi:MAG: hypothetical protein NXI24_01655 [bacterium]|nr:hypothetical protein [bacterium]
MSYILSTGDIDRMEFFRERAPGVFRWLVSVLGVAALCAGPALYYGEYLRALDLPVMLAGFGLLLIAAGQLLGIQIRSLPAAMALDNRRGVLEIREHDGREFSLGYGDIERVALRMRGRGRVVVALIRSNGAYWDLYRTNRRSTASEVGTRIQNFIQQGRRKERTYPDPGEGFEEAQDPTAIYWRDRLMPRASLWVFWLIAGMATLAGGFLLRAEFSLNVAAGLPAIALGLFAAFLLFGLWFDRRGIRVCEAGFEYGFARRDQWVTRKSIDFADIADELYNFDMYGGVPEILLPDAELYPRITGRDAPAAGSGAGQSPAASSKSKIGQELARIKADARAGLRVARFTLSGVGAGDALALEFWLQKQRREHRT